MSKNNTELVKKDLENIWHPCSQMKDYETFTPQHVVSAKGSYLELASGKRIIDAISSWWCKSLGHGHPRLQQALLKQLNHFEHIMLPNTTHETIISLSEKLTRLLKTPSKVFYASDGSCAVEIAMKMSLHSRLIKGQSNRQHFLALSNSYHGETGLALSVSDIGLYRAPYENVLPHFEFLQNIPYVHNKRDPLWNDCSSIWPTIEADLNKHAKTLTAIIIEPILQGAGGMLMYSPDFLKRLSTWTSQNDIHLIADEILTGLGRVGKPLGCDYANITPDFLCLGKGLTGGFLPLSAVVVRDEIYDLFYDDYTNGNSFLHSNTFAGNALAAAVANEYLNLIDEENVYEQVNQLEHCLAHSMLDIAENTKLLTDVRYIGGMVAADLVLEDPSMRMGWEVYKIAMQTGAFLRPLGNTIYWLPPLNINLETIHELKVITEQSIRNAYKKHLSRIYYSILDDTEKVCA